MNIYTGNTDFIRQHNELTHLYREKIGNSILEKKSATAFCDQILST